MTKHGLSGPAFVKKIRDAIKQYDMLRAGDRVLVAVSGGPDSVCLLRVLLQMKKALGVELVAANLDHGIRGRESKRDSDFVRDLSKELGLACAHRKIDLGTRRKNKKSLEEYARERRYAFFKQAAGKYRCNVIATGHTLDDQAETVLIRLMTGASLRGIAGIPAVRYEDDLKVIRPLIRTPKKEVLDYMGAGGWKYREDRTNKDRKYLRNRIRHEVLPFLERYNPRVRRSLANLCDTIREDLEFIELEKAKAV
ncbi:MAG: tRNA lysidine(34) synthetase TilS, partial [Candidatus Omnitrophica bacterium]|nr:tRNA lysidine(34) synthetase TilS [Candidatus Omnitrophota bacterium]